MTLKEGKNDKTVYLGDKACPPAVHAISHPLMSSPTDKYSDTGAVWVRSCLGWHSHIKPNEFNKDLHKEYLELCVARTSCLLEIFMATTAAHVGHKNAPVQTKGLSSHLQPSRLSPRGVNNRCATREHRHRENTQWCSCRMLLQDYSWGIPVAEAVSFTEKAVGGFFSQLFQRREVFLSPLYSSSSQQHSPDTDPQGVTKQQQNQAQTDPAWLSSLLCCTQRISALLIAG